MVIALFVVLLGSCAARADAATGKPVTTCGSKVTWTVEFESLAPGGARNSVAWAYSQVAPVARVQTKATDTGKVRWQWIDPMSGVSAEDADSWETSLSNGRYRLHSHRIEGEMSAATLRTQAIRDVLRDLGLPNPTSTAGGLSARDRQALRRACATQKVTPGTKAGSKPAAKAPMSTSVDTAEAERRVETVPMVPPLITSIAFVVAGLVVVGLLVYLAKPSLGGRVAVLVRAGRGRVATARKTRLRVPADKEDEREEAGEQ